MRNRPLDFFDEVREVGEDGYVVDIWDDPIIEVFLKDR